jgi:tetratricopeptide (TPR) repeat protein
MLWPLVLSAAFATLPLMSPKKAEKAAVSAEELWRDGHYDEASALLRKAYELDPRPEYLYARASVEKDAGRCETTVELFEAFLATGPPEQDAAAARTAMKPCQDQLEVAAAERPPEEAEPEEEDVPPPPVSGEPEPATPSDRPPRKDVLAGVLVGVGSGAALAGIGTLVAGIVIHRNAEDAMTADAFVDERERGRLLTGIGIGVAATGVAIAIAGAIRYGVLARKHRAGTTARERGPRSGLTLGPGSVGVWF